METNKGKGSFAAKVIIGGVSGVMIGSSSMATKGDAIIENETPEADTSGTDNNYENMSFGEAFAAARGELGSEGTFEWHGNLYSTCTAEEWAASHPSESLAGAVSKEIEADTFAGGAVMGEASSENEVEILGMEDDVDDTIEVEIETASDINGDEAAFIEIEDVHQSDAMDDIYVGSDTDQVSDDADYSNDDVSMI